MLRSVVGQPAFNLLRLTASLGDFGQSLAFAVQLKDLGLGSQLLNVPISGSELLLGNELFSCCRTLCFDLTHNNRQSVWIEDPTPEDLAAVVTQARWSKLHALSTRSGMQEGSGSFGAATSGNETGTSRGEASLLHCRLLTQEEADELM